MVDAFYQQQVVLALQLEQRSHHLLVKLYSHPLGHHLNLSFRYFRFTQSQGPNINHHAEAFRPFQRDLYHSSFLHCRSLEDHQQVVHSITVKMFWLCCPFRLTQQLNFVPAYF